MFSLVFKISLPFIHVYQKLYCSVFNESEVLTYKATIFENKVYIHGRLFCLVCIFKTHNKEEIIHINFASISRKLTTPCRIWFHVPKPYEHATR